MPDDALHLLAGMVLDDGARWGEVAADFQLDDARAVLEPGDDDPRLNWLSRSKGSSKTTDLAGMAMAWLVAQAAQLEEGFVVASDEEQACVCCVRRPGSSPARRACGAFSRCRPASSPTCAPGPG